MNSYLVKLQACIMRHCSLKEFIFSEVAGLHHASLFENELNLVAFQAVLVKFSEYLFQRITR